MHARRTVESDAICDRRLAPGSTPTECLVVTVFDVLPSVVIDLMFPSAASFWNCIVHACHLKRINRFQNDLRMWRSQIQRKGWKACECETLSELAWFLNRCGGFSGSSTLKCTINCKDLLTDHLYLVPLPLSPNENGCSIGMRLPPGNILCIE